MNNQSNNYCLSISVRSEENRQVIMLVLLSKLALVLLIGVVYVVYGL